MPTNDQIGEDGKIVKSIYDIIDTKVRYCIGIDDNVDKNAGFKLIKKHGNFVKKGEEIAEVFCSDKNKIERGAELFKKSIEIINQLPNEYKLIY